MCNGHALQVALSGGVCEYAHVCTPYVHKHEYIGPLISTRYCLECSLKSNSQLHVVLSSAIPPQKIHSCIACTRGDSDDLVLSLM